ncbi:MAG: hypothetical protein KF816_15360 [Melioribacteraceae bacterium]|jgi:hypothetical protein|nr:hypothetical protein [Melioribacteraceae bacterium]
MKKLFLSVLMFAAISSVIAQSDFEKIQNFKTKLALIEQSIKDAASIEDCDIVENEIIKLKTEYSPSRTLIDNSLYPDDWSTSFARIEQNLRIRRGDFGQIVELRTEVGVLRDKVSEISIKNEGLISQIRLLQINATKDAQTIASLTKLVAQLKANIAQRDELVRGIVDSLLAEFVKYPTTLNDVEKQSIFERVDNGNLFYNVERTIADNVQFMKVTELLPEDLSEMKKQYRDFNKVWRQVGPKLADIYMSKRDKASHIANIDNMFLDWNMRLNDEMWGQVNRLFREKQLALLPFKSGEQFFNSVSSFIDDEIKNQKVKSSSESERVYNTFIDSVYFKSVEPIWIPILIENSMMSEANKDSIDAKIGRWKTEVAPGGAFNWVYILLIGIIVVLIVALFLKGRKKEVIVKNEID